MTKSMSTQHRITTRMGSSLTLVVALSALSCRTAGTPLMIGQAPVVIPPAASQPSVTDPRVGLKGGLQDATAAADNIELIGHVAKPAQFNGDGGPRGLVFANSDLGFKGNYVYQGNFSGFQIWDISNPASPALTDAFVCGTGQGDPSIYGNLLFISSESTGDRTDCGTQGIKDVVSKDRMVGVRVFDVSDPAHPRKAFDIQTCRGSHTHTLVPDPTDKSIVYVYVSGSAGVRSAEEMPGCLDFPIDSANSSRFRVEVIRVPLAHPEQAQVVSSARIFGELAPPKSHGQAPADIAIGASRADVAAAGLPAGGPPVAATAGRGGRAGGPPGGGGRAGPNQCHDITVYPGAGYAGGACGGYGLLLDIRDPANPKRIQAVGDSNFAFWHSATFNNDGTKVVFTDEWGGGTAPKCRKDDPIDWGGDAIFSIENGKMKQHAYFKMPAAQTSNENCVAHNGSLVPVPGRDIMVQGWYQGGLDVFDFTDPNHPYEIAYFDRGPVDPTKLVTGGYWAAYWYNGHIIASEIARGLDIFELKPNQYLSQNEIDAAKLVRWDEFNPQNQPKIVWPPAFPVVRSYLDQLRRERGLSSSRLATIGADIDKAEIMSGSDRRSALNSLASQLDGDATGSTNSSRVRQMAAAARNLANASM